MRGELPSRAAARLAAARPERRPISTKLAIVVLERFVAESGDGDSLELSGAQGAMRFARPVAIFGERRDVRN